MAAKGFDGVRVLMDDSAEKLPGGSAYIPPDEPAAKAPRDPFAAAPPKKAPAPAPTGTRRMAPKAKPEDYATWPGAVQDGEYEYKRAPSGNDTFVITKAPADKAHLVGATLSPEIVSGSPRLTASLDAIRKKVTDALGPADPTAGMRSQLADEAGMEDRISAAEKNTATAAKMPDTPGMASAMGIESSTEKTTSKPRPYAKVRDLLGGIRNKADKTKMGDPSNG
jgi:hypothetical protein